MTNNQAQYLSQASLDNLKKELDNLKNDIIPEIAKKIDEAKQQGDLSENAEYHQAREEMSWARGRLQKIEQIIQNAEIIIRDQNNGAITVGCNVIVKINGQTKNYTIVGPHEIDPAKGYISNESPLGAAFLGHQEGDELEINTPSGKQIYQIVKIS